MKPTGRFCFCLFHSYDPKPKRNHQIACSRAKTESSHPCVKYRGNVIWIRRNRDVNTSGLKILHKKRQNKIDFLEVISNFSKMSFGLLQPNA